MNHEEHTREGVIKPSRERVASENNVTEREESETS